ncbi:MAG TPA: hypothetical protein VJN43_14390 [Bryobacteraceae bacterium]|nr:hypothetical protein [Bryobacteraceae bacterium]
MKTLVVFCICAVAACAQGGGTVVGAGYHGFAPISVAPGQVITVFVTSVGNATQAISAGKPPLPTTLGGDFGNVERIRQYSRADCLCEPCHHLLQHGNRPSAMQYRYSGDLADTV